MPITTVTAQDVIDSAPLGAIIRSSDGTPQPPARFKRKLSAWENRNGTGRLTEKRCARDGRLGDFTLHLGDWGTNDVIIMSINRVYCADSRGSFSVEQVPQDREHAPAVSRDEPPSSRCLPRHGACRLSGRMIVERLLPG
jgi:hypothetical protein